MARLAAADDLANTPLWPAPAHHGTDSLPNAATALQPATTTVPHAAPVAVAVVPASPRIPTEDGVPVTLWPAPAGHVADAMPNAATAQQPATTAGPHVATVAVAVVPASPRSPQVMMPDESLPCFAGSGRFACSVCERRFIRSAHCQRHARTHAAKRDLFR